MENGGAGGCVGEFQNACVTVDRSGFVVGPAEVRGSSTSCGTCRTWCVAAWLAILRVFFSRIPLSETVVLAQSAAADQAHLRSHSGPGASEVFCCTPTKQEFKMQQSVFRTVILERLRLPLDITNCRCECGGSVELGPSPCCMPQDRETLDPGNRSGEDTHQCVAKQGQSCAT